MNIRIKLSNARHAAANGIHALEVIERGFSDKNCFLPSRDAIDDALTHLRVAVKWLEMTLCAVLLIGLVACEGGSDNLTMTGTQKCTVTVNGKEEPCQR